VFEGDKRRILNFGHTIGHALETHFGFDILRHGEAIAYGMMAAGNLSIEHSGLKSEDCDYLKNTIQRLPLPELPDLDHKEILNIMENDKKVKSGNLHFILLEDIGSAVVQNNINDQSIVNVLEAL
jgi:3-dehydroquinate synthase